MRLDLTSKERRSPRYCQLLKKQRSPNVNSRSRLTQATRQQLLPETELQPKSPLQRRWYIPQASIAHILSCVRHGAKFEG
jgi:hypothetical protein